LVSSLASITRSGWLRPGPPDIGLPMALAAAASHPRM
jgi:hypothetical protein